MAPKKGGKEKGGKKSKADIEREEAARLAAEHAIIMENDAIEKQARENALRDQREKEEAELRERQARVAILTMKDQTIFELSQELDIRGKEHKDMKEEMLMELDGMRVAKEALEDELSETVAVMNEKIAKLEFEREQLLDDLAKSQEDQAQTEEDKQNCIAASKAKQAELQTQLDEVTAELQAKSKEMADRASSDSATIETLQGKVASLESHTEILKNSLKAREEDDLKNQQLIDMLKQKMDESQESFSKHLANESKRMLAMQDENIEMQRRMNQLGADLEEANKKMADKEQDWLAEASEYQVKLEKADFDAKYQQKSLQVMEKRLAKATAELEKSEQERQALVEGRVQLEDEYPTGPVRDPVIRNNMDKIASLTTECRNLRQKFEESQESTNQMEAMLKRREKDHLDRAAHLSAQISQHRTTITQLQSRVAQEKEARLEAVAALTEEVDRATNSLMMNRHEGDNQRMTMARLQARLQADASIMRASVFELQNAVVEKERELEQLKTERAQSLDQHKRDLLDQELRFAKLVNAARKGDEDVSAILQERVTLAEAELAKVRSESAQKEGLLNSQVASLTALVSEQTSELRTVKGHYEQTLSQMRSETSRLRDVLAANFIPSSGASA